MPLTLDKNNLLNHAWEADNPSTIDLFIIHIPLFLTNKYDYL